MSSIQQIIDTHTSELALSTEKVMKDYLTDLKATLINILADKYEFDVDEAMTLFPEEEIKPEKKQKTKKKTKKTKDPNAPKRPTTAYFFFMKAKRPEVAAEYPELKTTEITQKLGAMWQDIKDTPDAVPYNELNSADKTRYETEMLDYSAPSSPLSSD